MPVAACTSGAPSPRSRLIQRRHPHILPLSRLRLSLLPVSLLPVSLLLVSLLLPLAGCGADGASGPPEAGPPESIVFGAAVVSVPAGLPVRQSDAAVRVLDAEGLAVAGAVVRFEIVEGNGWLAAQLDTTDSGGHAGVGWYLDPLPGGNALRASAAGVEARLDATGEPLVPGQSYFGRGNYIELVAGDLPVIVSAPHGGALRPAEMPERTVGTFVQDRNTVELARAVAAAFHAEAGGTPHVVISHVHRIHLDPNRDIGEAAQGNTAAELAWREFQAFLDGARGTVTRAHGHGFYVDLHGHGHEVQRLELGYLLSATQLGAPDATLNTLAASTSVREIVQRTGTPLATVLKGPAGLGTLLEARGFPAVPAAGDPAPGSDPYFSGGYNTARHGSRNGGTVSGVQIECNYTGVREHPEDQAAFADALVAALESYFTTWFGAPLAATAAVGG